MKRISLMDVVVGIVGFFGLIVVGIIMFGYMVYHMIYNKIYYGKWWL